MSDESLMGKFFSITDPAGVNTVIYQVNKTEKEYQKTAPQYTVERLKFSEQLVGNNKKKTFYIENPAPDGNPLLFLSFGMDKVVINSGILEYDEIKISKKPIPMECKTLYSEEETEYRDFAYTPNMKRQMTIIDPETAEEVKPVLYFDEATNEVKGKCKLRPYKRYFIFEIKPSTTSKEKDDVDVRYYSAVVDDPDKKE